MHTNNIPVFHALVPEQLELEHLQLLGRDAKRTGFEVGSKSFNVKHAKTIIALRNQSTEGRSHA